MNQHRRADFMVDAQQGAFELLTQIDGPVLDDDRPDGQHLIAVHVQTAGFQIQHHPALLAQRLVTEPRANGQLFKPLQLMSVHWR